jgi:MFS family permease
MASAQFVSNVGSWMQTVGAQELMLTLTSSATFVALIQTAAGLPVVLLAVPAGAIGDLVDRRRLLIISQSFMLLAAAVLAGLALAGLVTPLVLLLLIFAVGVGQTQTSPTWQTLQPELVAPEDRTQAIGLGAVNQNLSRAIGPAIGGALHAATSAGALFVVNAVSFVPVIGAVTRWPGRGRAGSGVAREHVGGAIRAGGRYVAARPALRAWILALSTLSSQYQSTLPRWAKARGMSYYLVIFQGGGAIGAAVFGAIAQSAGLTGALLIAAGGLACAALAGLWLPFRKISSAELLPSGDWPAPQLVGANASDGPVDELAGVARREQPRARPGAVHRRLLGGNLRQHERVSVRDQHRLDEIAAMTDPSRHTKVTHWLAPHVDRNAPTAGSGGQLHQTSGGSGSV